MRQIIYLSIILFQTFSLHAQNVRSHQTGVASTIQKVAMSSSTGMNNLTTLNWNISMQTLNNEAEDLLGATAILKQKNRSLKLQSIQSVHNQTQHKTAAATPTIGANFKGNDLKTWTPSDNSVAISNDGKIVNTTNYCYDVYDTAGNIFIQHQIWKDFVNDTNLKSNIFDPRVIYDNKHNRFILVVLHGYTPATSKIVTCFSKTNNPMDGWNIYKLSGNPFNNNAWTDFPTIGINDDELFINGNQFGPNPYPFKGSYIYQIGLLQGYAGDSLQFVTWNQIAPPDSNPPVTMYPASHGQGKSIINKMYFVHLAPDSGSNVYVYRIDGKLSDPNKTLTATQYPIPYYEVCADAFEKDTATGFVDSLSTGAAWIQNAFFVKNTIHFTQCADLNNWCGIHYGRIDLDSNKVSMAYTGLVGTDLAYPAGISFGYNQNDPSAVITYVRSDTTIFPEMGVVSIDSAMTWSNLQTVKTGDTTVNILFTPNYAPQPERWGDYSGICRKYNTTIPEAWLAASYAANNTRKACYNTWIAQVKTNEPAPVNNEPLHTNLLTKNESTLKVYPNPASNQFVIEFNNDENGFVNVDIVDMNGRIIKILFEDYLQKSINKISFNQLMLANGIYTIRINRNNKTIRQERLSIQ
jgi:hypothetical protein